MPTQLSYDPATAQFISRDPAVEKTRSAYGYVGGNPVNGSDPTGLDYDYYYAWDAGPAGGSRSPASTLWWLTHRADYEFPFEIHNLSMPYTVHGPGSISDVGGVTNSLCQGGNYAITANGLSNPIHVDFAGMMGNVAVLQFSALPGHSEGTGSTIRFSAWVSKGRLMFDVTGHDTFNYDGVPNAWFLDSTWGWLAHGADSAFYVQHLWDQLAAHVAA